jgi:hypothetical protein
VRSLYSPIKTFSSAKGERSYTNPLVFLVGLGLVTALLSGVLNEFGIDYSNPSNAGGSAQLFAPWVILVFAPSLRGVARVLVFALSVEAGYLILTLPSVVVVSLIARALAKNSEGRRNPFLKALKAVCYGMGPGLFFGWIPNPVYLFGLWATAWQALGIYVYFDLTRVRTIVTTILWVLIIGGLHDIALFMWTLFA